ncbi:MAG TPA: methyltransferase domain-containing protein [Bacteroidota bacterium]|nr:methyltransferase domain-containing protein [Bacteroidota bacterium]
MSTVNEIERARVAEAFNSVAESFEAVLENDITRGLRQRIYETIRSLTPPGSNILDINCGTGIDAVALAEEGYKVVGIDVAPKMIEEAKRRSKKVGANNVEFLVGSFEDLSLLTGRRFDLVLSNFGGLNCVNSLNTVAEQVAQVVRPGGYFVAMVMPPVCLWEIVAGLVRMNFRFAFRRLRKNVQATGFRGGTFTVHYYSPRTFTAAFRRWFKVRKIMGLNIISPPPHATGFKTIYPRLSSRLERLEGIVARLPGVRGAGDHFVAVLQKLES